MQLENLIKISRPRFRMYLFGPFLIWRVAWINDLYQWDMLSWLVQYKTFILAVLLLVAADYFLFSANLFVYGINDLSDDDTDQYNSKKWSYEHSLQKEERTRLARHIIIFAWAEWMLLMLLLVWTQKVMFWYIDWRRWILALVLFWATSYLYSSLPVRAKSLPFIDGLFNVLYIFPAIVWRLVSWHNIEWFAWLAFWAWWLRAMGMHAYSAIPDIEPDRKASLVTTAVYLWKEKTLVYCWLLRSLAAILAYDFLWTPIILVLLLYITAIILSFRTKVMNIYKRFPWINGFVGFLLFWLIVL